MLESRPFAYDELGRVSKWFHYDDATDEVIIEDELQLNEIAAFNAERRKENTGRFGDGMAWIGSIPMAVYWRLKEKGIIEDQAAFRRWWMSDEALPFRGRDIRL